MDDLKKNKHRLIAELSDEELRPYVNFFTQRFMDAYTELGVFHTSRVSNKTVISDYIKGIFARYGKILTPGDISKVFQNGVMGMYGKSESVFTVQTLIEWIEGFVSKMDIEKASAKPIPQSVSMVDLMAAISGSVISCKDKEEFLSILIDGVIKAPRMKPFRDYVEKEYKIAVCDENRQEIINLFINYGN